MATRGRRHMLYEGKCPAKAIHVAGEVWFQPLVGLLPAPGQPEPFQPLGTIHLSIGNFSPGPSICSVLHAIAQSRGCSSAYEKGRFFFYYVGGFLGFVFFFLIPPALLNKLLWFDVAVVTHRAPRWLCSGAAHRHGSAPPGDAAGSQCPRLAGGRRRWRGGASLSERGALRAALLLRPKRWVLPGASTQERSKSRWERGWGELKGEIRRTRAVPPPALCCRVHPSIASLGGYPHAMHPPSLSRQLRGLRPMFAKG